MDIGTAVAEIELFFEAIGPLVTVMDRDGAITYANHEFMEVSGFSHIDLIGTNHEAMWHPDMPRICHTNLWLTIKCDKPYRGMVKNRCAQNAFFWTESITTPLRENDQTVGYITLSNAPSRKQVNDAEALYTIIKAGESKNSQRILDFYQAAREQLNPVLGLSPVFSS